MKVTLIRHGETTTSGRCYAGRSDVPLTQHGQEQAARLAHELASDSVTHLLVSPLSRAIDTARPLARVCGLVPLVSPALVEIDFGVLEGQQKGKTGLSLRKSHSHVPIPGGEALADVWKRAGEVIDLIPSASETHCLLVGHFWINRLIWARLQGLSFSAACASRQYRPKTGSWVALNVP